MSRILITLAAIAICCFIVWNDFTCLSHGGHIIYSLNITYACVATAN